MSTPLVNTNDAGLIARAYNLGLKVVPNLPHILCADDLAYWESHLDELKEALTLGLTRTKPVPTERKIELVHLSPITSDGRTGKTFVTDLRKKKFNVGDYAEYVMTKSKDAAGNLAFVSTTGIVYKPVVIKGEQFSDNERVTSNIRKVAEEMKLITPPAELAPLLRESFSDDDIAKLGLTWLIVMHEAITDSDGRPSVLALNRDSDGRDLVAYDGYPSLRWGRGSGFVFLAPQE